MTPRLQTRSPETDPAALLGDELRELRIAAGYRSQDDIASIAGTDRSVIGKVETGDRPPTPELLVAMLDAYKVSGRLRRVYERLGRVARARGDGAVKIWFAGYLQAEREAHALRFWAPTILPGLVQTEAYARAVFLAMGMSDEEVQGQVTTRLGRQSILSRLDPPSVVIVIWEPVLYHLIGSAEVMREQLERLLELSHRVVIQVVPSRIGANSGLGGSIALATRPGAPEVLLATSMVEDIVTKDADQVRRASVTFDQVRADALPRGETRSAISEAVEQWKTR